MVRLILLVAALLILTLAIPVAAVAQSPDNHQDPLDDNDYPKFCYYCHYRHLINGSSVQLEEVVIAANDWQNNVILGDADHPVRLGTLVALAMEWHYGN